MGELFVMNQPRRRSPLPGTLGILGSSKGNTYAVGSEGGGGTQVAVPVQPAQVSAVLQTLNNIANEQPPQKITATGETVPGSLDKARRFRPPTPALQPPPPVYVPIPYSWPGGTAPSALPAPTATAAPGPAFPGGGGGGGGAAAGDDQAAATDPPVFLGLTQKQLVIGGGLAVVGFLLLRKKRPPAAAGGV